MLKNISVIISLSMLSFSAHSALITWEIKSAITELTPHMAGYADIGDVITLRYTFDSETPDVEPWVAERGEYDNAVISADINLNSYNARFNNVGYISVLNDYSNGKDVYRVASVYDAELSESLPSYNGYRFSGFGLSFSDLNATMFDSVELMTNPFTGFGEYRIGLQFRDPATSIGAAIGSTELISFERVSAVPIPAAVWLFSSGLMGLIGFSRRKKS